MPLPGEPIVEEGRLITVNTIIYSTMNRKDIINNIHTKLGIEQLNPMQEACAQVVMPAELLLLAPTGSGKTLAFAIPFLRSLGRGEGRVMGVVLAPSRELVLQIYDILRRVAGTEYKTVAFYGGHSMAEEVKSLAVTPDIIVATPGRLVDHIQRGQVSLYDVTSVVLDEYDKSLELGFYEEMRRIIGRMANMKTLILTSATRSAGLPDFLVPKDLKTLDYIGEDSAGDTVVPDITVHRVDSPERDKIRTLEQILAGMPADSRRMVFVNHRESADRVYQALVRDGFPATLYHGGLEQNDRELAIVKFNNGSAPVLVCTDLAARGLDINDVGAVVHYHLPVASENWTHRNGRTARMGASGEAYVIVNDADRVPDFVVTDDTVTPEAEFGPQAQSPWITLHFNVGKKEKISRGDIAGYLMQKGGLAKDEVGVIDVRDHQSFVAVPRDRARDAILAAKGYKIKNQRVRITQMK